MKCSGLHSSRPLVKVLSPFAEWWSLWLRIYSCHKHFNAKLNESSIKQLSNLFTICQTEFTTLWLYTLSLLLQIENTTVSFSVPRPAVPCLSSTIKTVLFDLEKCNGTLWIGLLLEMLFTMFRWISHCRKMNWSYCLKFIQKVQPKAFFLVAACPTALLCLSSVIKTLLFDLDKCNRMLRNRFLIENDLCTEYFIARRWTDLVV